VTYLYNALDQLTEKQYSDTGALNPTPWVRNTYDKSWLTKVQAGPWSYNQAHGAIQTQTLANGNLGLSRIDNARLQPLTIQAGTQTGNLLTLDYVYSPTSNNGNVTSQTITRPGIGAWTQTYGYVANRLTTAQEGTWSQTYGYDNRGNRWVNPNTVPYPSPFTPALSVQLRCLQPPEHSELHVRRGQPDPDRRIPVPVRRREPHDRQHVQPDDDAVRV